MVGVTKKSEEIEQVKLEFSEQLAPYIITKPIHPTQKTKKIDDKLLVTIEVIPNYELVSLILAFGENVKVISPESLKSSVRQKLQKGLSNYSD